MRLWIRHQASKPLVRLDFGVARGFLWVPQGVIGSMSKGPVPALRRTVAPPPGGEGLSFEWREGSTEVIFRDEASTPWSYHVVVQGPTSQRMMHLEIRKHAGDAIFSMWHELDFLMGDDGVSGPRPSTGTSAWARLGEDDVV